MDFIKDELDKEFNAVGFRSKRKNLKYKPYQTGTTNNSIDNSRKALLSGKRISKSGNIYYEYRKNRSDKKGSKI